MSSADPITKSKYQNKIVLFINSITLLLLLTISLKLNLGAATLSSSLPHISLHRTKTVSGELVNYHVVLLSKLSNAQQEIVMLLLLGSLLLCLATGLKHSRLLKLHSKLKATGFEFLSPMIGKAMYQRVIQTIIHYRGQYGKY